MPSPKSTIRKRSLAPITLAALEKRLAALEHRVPDSWIVSEKFWKRAFGVFGHVYAATGALYAAVLVLILLAMVIGVILGAGLNLFVK